MFGDIPSFPIDDILSCEVLQEPLLNPSQIAPESTLSENLKVFLRIRPLQNSGKVGDSKSRTKNAWPQNPLAKNMVKEKKSNKKSEMCILVNDSRSITLTPPLALQDTKKTKSEVFEGFSHVFSVDSSQGEVYEMMVNPLVEDFLKGKDGMLAALGPSGSGKTHTIFGCRREPGMISRILQKIFKQTESSNTNPSRTFSISMFEIYSERGKGEGITDLFADGGEKIIRQSSVKGLQEFIISDVAGAESLIARGMLKRATATTNTNSQSSRSQCIINIRCASKMVDGKVDADLDSAVLTIVDLAGAEREKRTGNQGARLLESNFINNTSMVFGLCLRSLLEHQKNPKKQLQKHFQNSLLTRYLRDYLEGKKRMTLILTVKPGEEDYLDTSFLLRQASPFMKIKFKLVEKAPNLHGNKRQIQTFPRYDQPKRVKVNGIYASETEEKKSDESHRQLSVEEATKEKWKKVDSVIVLPKSPEDLKTNTNEITDRNNLIMQNFAKALWNALKEYKKKLEVSESEVRSLKIEREKYIELEKELRDLKSRCSCSKGISFNNEDSHSTNHDESEWTDPSKKCDSFIENGQHIILQAVVEASSPNQMGLNCRDSELKSDVVNPDASDGLSPCIKDYSQQCSQIKSSHVGAVDCNRFFVEDVNLQNDKVFERASFLIEGNCGDDELKPNANKYANFSVNVEEAEIFDKLRALRIEDVCSVEEKTDDSLVVYKEDQQKQHVSSLSEVAGSSFQPIIEISGDNSLVLNMEHESFRANLENTEDCDKLRTLGIEDNCFDKEETDHKLYESTANSIQSDIEISSVEISSSVDLELQNTELDMKLLDPVQTTKEDEQKPNTCCEKSIVVEKPKRKLLPASSILLRDVGFLNFEDENEKPKEKRGEKKSYAYESYKTQGSLSLLRLLQKNRHP